MIIKRIKFGYLAIIIVLIIASVISLILFNDSPYTNIILSVITAIIATLALSFTDLKKDKFKGRLLLWSASLPKDERVGEKITMLSLKIENSNDEPIDDFIYRIRVPSKYFSFNMEKNSNAQVYISGNSEIVVDSSFGFLGKEGPDSFIPINFKSDLDNWKNGHILLTITGKSIYPFYFQIKPENEIISKILGANSSYPHPINSK